MLHPRETPTSIFSLITEASSMETSERTAWREQARGGRSRRRRRRAERHGAEQHEAEQHESKHENEKVSESASGQEQAKDAVRVIRVACGYRRKGIVEGNRRLLCYKKYSICERRTSVLATEITQVSDLQSEVQLAVKAAALVHPGRSLARHRRR